MLMLSVIISIAAVVAKEAGMPNDLSSNIEGFGPSKFDSLLSPSIPMSDLKGYANDHNHKRDHKGFGNLSIISFNMESATDSSRDGLQDFVLGLLDSSHPSVMTLQSIRKKEIDALSTKLLGHYGILNDDQGSINVLESPKLYLPIIYDTQHVRKISNGYYRNPEQSKIIYASWAVFETLATKQWFTVINLDLYNAYEEKIDVKMANILRDIHVDPTISARPVFYMGRINVASDRLKQVIENNYINPLDKDINSKNEERFTMINPSDIQTDHQRDYILISEKKQNDPNAIHNVKTIHYARILRLGIPGLNYPIHTIVSL
ncbi:hypothetical protein CWI42_080900 [Ordospora colligata]|uniref:Endonuclease/exonuclease/phosphatase domain-containing protein n=1 Tax=Ordospora colligata OC4 TaxID=1354746 RepID=A0A0B2UJF9_9MICR|nr:uncharacterized protein M896_080900 [Ordospora colligata OC4]KHN69354.1 hypothetical protein M896_080900 [Ordospora colligata OC4]TBU14868.1 hypothetical protein CWI41_080890 [Ordospora colligata]TBU14999.1 hypothetical protein CWI40_080910 [Ordospora colligata]TBU18253.1 hypothetical protein CWI42_080900 [Ordospora colligata]